jgi:hypothetical protein
MESLANALALNGSDRDYKANSDHLAFTNPLRELTAKGR